MGKQVGGIDAHEVLQQSLDLIKATYWVIGIEWKKFSPREVPTELKRILVPVRLSSGRTSTKQKEAVTGVCSTGAMSLATSILRDKPLIEFGILAHDDLPNALCAQALYRTFVKMKTYDESLSDYLFGDDPIGMITEYNDMQNRTRKQIISLFTKALKQPCLEWEQIVFLRHPEDEYRCMFGFPDEATAKAEIKRWRTGKNSIAEGFQVWASNHFWHSRAIDKDLDKWQDELTFTTLT